MDEFFFFLLSYFSIQKNNHDNLFILIRPIFLSMMYFLDKNPLRFSLPLLRIFLFSISFIPITIIIFPFSVHYQLISSINKNNSCIDINE